MIRAKLIATSTNGNGHAPPAFKHIPPDLRSDISEILETEGMMETSAENRILTRMDGHHRETLSEIGELRDKIHGQDNRLVVVEANAKKGEEAQRAAAVEITEIKRTTADDITKLAGVAKDVGTLMDAAKTAGEERRNNGRLIKGTFVSALASIVLAPLTGGLVGFYVLRQTPPVQESLKTDAAISSKLDKLTNLMIEEREARKANEAEPPDASLPRQAGGRSKTRPARHPEPLRLNMLRGGELHADKELLKIPVISSNRPPAFNMRLPE